MLIPEIAQEMGGRIRVRVGGLVVEKAGKLASLLLVRHRGIWDADPFWTPPGGEVGVGESLQDALKREIREETGLEVSVGKLCYVTDFIRAPLHAVSLFFQCTSTGGRLSTGKDPELARQLILDVGFLPVSELEELHLVPEGIGKEIPFDVENGFSRPCRYLGTRY